MFGKTSSEIESLVQQSLAGLSPGQETVTNNPILNQLFSNEESNNRLKQIAAAQELLETAGAQLKATGLQTDLAVAYLSSDKDALIEREAKLAQVASRASETTTLEALFSSAGVMSAKEYYRDILHKDITGKSEDEIKQGILAEIMATANKGGSEGLKNLVGDDLWRTTFAPLLGDSFAGINDIINTTETLGIANINNFKNLKISDIKKELTKVDSLIEERQRTIDILKWQGLSEDEIKETTAYKELSIMQSYEKVIDDQTASIAKDVAASFGANLSQKVLSNYELGAAGAFNQLQQKYDLNQLQAIGGYITQGNVFYGKNTADTIFQAFNDSQTGGKEVFAALNKIDWSTSLSGLADLSTYAKRAGDSMETFDSLLKAAVKDVGEEGGIFQKLYNASGFQKTLDKLETTYQTTGKITAQDVLKLADKNEELYNYLQIGKNTEDLDITAAGLAATLESISKGDITADQVSSGLVSAFSAANQREDIEAEAFDIVKSQDLGQSGSILVNFGRELGKAFYTAKTNRLTMDDPLMNAIDLMPTFYQDKYYEGLRTGVYQSFNDIIKDPDLKPMVDFLTLMGGTGKYKGKGGGYFTDIINFFGKEMAMAQDLSTENGNFLIEALAEEGLIWDNSIFGVAKDAHFTTTNFRNTLEGILSSIMNKEAAHEWATVFTEYGSNTSLGMHFGIEDTKEAITKLQEDASKGQYFTKDGKSEGLHYYSMAELEAFFNSRKKYLDTDIYGTNPDLSTFIKEVVNGNAQLLAQNEELFKAGAALDSTTLDKILTSNKELNQQYGISNEQTFENISSLLYSYGAITSQGDQRFLDETRFADFITASGGSAEAASKILENISASYGSVDQYFQKNNEGSVRLGRTVTDVNGQEWSIVQKDNESYQDYAARAEKVASAATSDKIWVDTGTTKIGDLEIKGQYIDDPSGQIREALKAQGYTLNEDGSYSLDKGLIEGNLGGNGATAEGGTTGTPSEGGTEGSSETTPGSSTTSTTTTSTPTTTGNYATESDVNAAISYFGGWEQASAAAKAMGISNYATYEGVMSAYALSQPGKTGWKPSASEKAAYEKTIPKDSHGRTYEESRVRGRQQEILAAQGYSLDEINAIISGRITKEGIDAAKKNTKASPSPHPTTTSGQSSPPSHPATTSDKIDSEATISIPAPPPYNDTVITPPTVPTPTGANQLVPTGPTPKDWKMVPDNGTGNKPSLGTLEETGNILAENTSSLTVAGPPIITPDSISNFISNMSENVAKAALTSKLGSQYFAETYKLDDETWAQAAARYAEETGSIEGLIPPESTYIPESDRSRPTTPEQIKAEAAKQAQYQADRDLEAKAAARAQALRDQQATEAEARDEAFLKEQQEAEARYQADRDLEAKAAEKAQALREQQAAEAKARDEAFLKEQQEAADNAAKAAELEKAAASTPPATDMDGALIPGTPAYDLATLKASMSPSEYDAFMKAQENQTTTTTEGTQTSPSETSNVTLTEDQDQINDIVDRMVASGVSDDAIVDFLSGNITADEANSLIAAIEGDTAATEDNTDSNNTNTESNEANTESNEANTVSNDENTKVTTTAVENNLSVTRPEESDQPFDKDGNQAIAAAVAGGAKPGPEEEIQQLGKLKALLKIWLTISPHKQSQQKMPQMKLLMRMVHQHL